MTLRLYYNKRGELPWSIDEGDVITERCVRDVLVLEVNSCTRVAPHLPAELRDLHPVAWLEFTHAKLEVVGVYAVIKPMEKR